MNSIREYLEHDWQTIGRVRDRLERGGVKMSEIALFQIIKRTVPDALFTADRKQVRLRAPEIKP